jgi:hypothetical protein
MTIRDFLKRSIRLNFAIGVGGWLLVPLAVFLKNGGTLALLAGERHHHK